MKIKSNILGNKVLDLCCGSGEITRMLSGYDVTGLDPYMNEVYSLNADKECLKLSFKEIVEGKLLDNFDSIICSFALHLCPESMLPLSVMEFV